MSRWGTDREDYDVNERLSQMQKTETARKRIQTDPPRQSRPVTTEDRRPSRVKRRIRELTIKGYSTDEITEIVNRTVKITKVTVSAIRAHTRETMKVLDEMGHLKGVAP